MRTSIFLLIGISLLAAGCTLKDKQQNTEQASEENWTVLFENSNTNQWRDTKSDHFPENGWLIEGDVITVMAETESQTGGHDIITKEQYSNFELELEVNLTEGANSGVKYLVTNSFPGKNGSFLGPEYQLLDNERNADALNGRYGNHKMGALYDMIPPPESISIFPPGEWNKIRIIVDGNNVEHWLNDEKILEYNRKSLAFRELVSLSKYSDLDSFGEIEKGHILLQGHGSNVSFRAIRIRTW